MESLASRRLPAPWAAIHCRASDRGYAEDIPASGRDGRRCSSGRLPIARLLASFALAPGDLAALIRLLPRYRAARRSLGAVRTPALRRGMRSRSARRRQLRGAGHRRDLLRRLGGRRPWWRRAGRSVPWCAPAPITAICQQLPVDMVAGDLADERIASDRALGSRRCFISLRTTASGRSSRSSCIGPTWMEPAVSSMPPAGPVSRSFPRPITLRPGACRTHPHPAAVQTSHARPALMAPYRSRR